jgi:hypothetical protein
MEFTKFTSLENSYREKYIGILRRYGYDKVRWVAHEKIHGCLTADSLIQTREYGKVSIGWIVNNRVDCHVLSVNVATGEKEWDRVIAFQNVPNDGKQWYKVTLDDDTTLCMTGNHKLWLPKEKRYEQVDNLINSAEVYLLKT